MSQDPGTIVFNNNDDASGGGVSSRAHAGRRPLAGIVEQVAEHFVEIVPMRTNGNIPLDRAVNRQALVRVQTLHCPHQTFRRLHYRRAGARHGA